MKTHFLLLCLVCFVTANEKLMQVGNYTARILGRSGKMRLWNLDKSLELTFRSLKELNAEGDDVFQTHGFESFATQDFVFDSPVEGEWPADDCCGPETVSYQKITYRGEVSRPQTGKLGDMWVETVLFQESGRILVNDGLEKFDVYPGVMKWTVGIDDWAWCIDQCCNGNNCQSAVGEFLKLQIDVKFSEEESGSSIEESTSGTEAPEGTEEPESTEDPEATEEPEATEDPEATEEPEATEDPEPTEESASGQGGPPAGQGGGQGGPPSGGAGSGTEAPETTEDPASGGVTRRRLQSSPSFGPTAQPTNDPTFNPSSSPTLFPTIDPTFNPSSSPSQNPSMAPTLNPTVHPSLTPTLFPTGHPTANPSLAPTLCPTANPTTNPSLAPTFFPTTDPTFNPTNSPTLSPSMSPTMNPTQSPVEALFNLGNDTALVISNFVRLGPNQTIEELTDFFSEEGANSHSFSFVFPKSDRILYDPLMSLEGSPVIEMTNAPTKDPTMSPTMQPTADPSTSTTTTSADSETTSIETSTTTSTSTSTTTSTTTSTSTSTSTTTSQAPTHRLQTSVTFSGITDCQASLSFVREAIANSLNLLENKITVTPGSGCSTSGRRLLQSTVEFDVQIDGSESEINAASSAISDEATFAETLEAEIQTIVDASDDPSNNPLAGANVSDISAPLTDPIDNSSGDTDDEKSSSTFLIIFIVFIVLSILVIVGWMLKVSISSDEDKGVPGLEGDVYPSSDKLASISKTSLPSDVELGVSPDQRIQGTKDAAE